ncbi:MAG: Fe-S cluster assembly protein SufD [Pseudomonadota bacterium]
MAEDGAFDVFTDGFDTAMESLPGDLIDARRQDLEAFRTVGLPGRRLEAWKFTDLRRFLMRHAFSPAQPVAVPPRLVEQIDTLRLAADASCLVFLNGRLQEDLSSTGGLPDGVTLNNLADVLNAPDRYALSGRLGAIVGETDDALIALNAAWMADGYVLDIAEGVELANPLHVVHAISACDHAIAVHPRHLIRLGPNAKATVIETHLGEPHEASFVNGVTEVEVRDRASLRHYRMANGPEQGFDVQRVYADLGRDSRFESFVVALGGQMTRTESVVALSGPGGETHLGGVYLGRDKQHRDNTILIKHDAPHCQSRQVFKGVLDDRARGVFQGKIRVDSVAQKTDGHQLNKSLLLSGGAEIDTKPELEIYADDVKCSHGATAGEIDGNALFYLRSRGIPEQAARQLLVQAFLAEALLEISDETVRADFERAVDDWMVAEFARKEAA